MLSNRRLHAQQYVRVACYWIIINNNYTRNHKHIKRVRATLPSQTDLSPEKHHQEYSIKHN